MYYEKLHLPQQKPTHFRLFESSDEMADMAALAADKYPTAIVRPEAGYWWDGLHGVIDYSHWVGRQFDNWKDVRDAVVGPWPHGVSVVDKMLGDMKDAKLPQPVSIRRQRVYRDDAGDDVCIERYMADKPYWVATQRQRRSGPQTLTIISDVGATGNVDADDVLWRGAATISLTYLLEQAGYRVELWACEHLKCTFIGEEGSFVGVCFKRPQDPLNMASMINVLSGWAMRSIFSACYCLTQLPVVSGLGYVRPLDDFIPKVTTDANAIVCAKLWSHDDATAWVRQQLQAFHSN